MLNKLDQAIEIVKQMKSIQDFYRYDWDVLAFSMSEGDIISLKPSQITIKHTSDLENAVYKFTNAGKFGQHFDVPLDELPPVEVDFDGYEYVLQDGHHRYEMARRSKMKLQCEISIKANPFLFLGITDDNTDNFFYKYHPRPNVARFEQFINENYSHNIPNIDVYYEKLGMSTEDAFRFIDYHDSYCNLYPGYDDSDADWSDEYWADSKENAYVEVNDKLDYLNSLPDIIPIYRTIRVNDIADVDEENLGECWSYRLESALAFGSHLKANVLMTATIDSSLVDWDTTVKLHFYLSGNGDEDDENEIRLYSGSDVQNLKIELIEKSKSFINESKKDVINLLTKYNIQKNELEYIQKNDPSSGKFLPWIIKQYATSIDFGRYEWDAVVDYYKLYKSDSLPKDLRDINRIKSTAELIKIVKHYNKVITRSDLDKLGKGNAVKVIETDNILILHIKSWEASVKYGKGTRWCISSKNDSGDFDVRNKTSKIFFIYLKDRQDDLYKLCFLRRTHQKIIYDAVDKSIDYWDFLYIIDFKKEYGIDLDKTIAAYLAD